VTGGNNAGVMKHVGEAVRDYGLTAEGRVIAIGIAPWGCVQNKEVLISSIQFNAVQSFIILEKHSSLNQTLKMFATNIY
jgi:hypothetical protein